MPNEPYPNGRSFHDLYAWAIPVLRFALDEAERGLAGFVTGVTRNRALRIILVQNGLPNAGIALHGNSINIVFTTGMLDFVDRSVAAYTADFLGNTPESVDAVGYYEWVRQMRREIRRGAGSQAGPARPIPWPGPSEISLEWNIKYIRTPAQGVYQLLFAHELSHLVLRLPSGGRTPAEILDREVRVDRHAFQSMGPMSDHREAMVSEGSMLPPYLVATLVAIDLYQQARSRALAEMFRVPGSPLQFQEVFPAAQWAYRAGVLVDDWEAACSGGAGTETCREGWQTAVAESRALIAEARSGMGGAREVALRLDRVVAALRNEAVGLAGAFKRTSRSGRTQYHSALIDLHATMLDRCEVPLYRSSTDTSASYMCWWYSESVDPLRLVFADLVDGLEARCDVSVAQDQYGSRVDGSCGELSVEGQFGREREGRYFIFLEIDD